MDIKQFGSELSQFGKFLFEKFEKVQKVPFSSSNLKYFCRAKHTIVQDKLEKLGVQCRDEQGSLGAYFQGSTKNEDISQNRIKCVSFGLKN